MFAEVDDLLDRGKELLGHDTHVQNQSHSQYNGRDMQNDFNRFCSETGLDDLTYKILVAEGCGSVKALAALEEGDLIQLRLPIGQRRLLERALGHATTVDQPQARSSSPSQLLTTTTNALSALQIGNGHCEVDPGTQDLALLGLEGGENLQYYDITQFVDMGVGGLSAETHEARGQRASSISQAKIGSLEDLYKISPFLWMGANAKINAKLLSEGKLQGGRAYGYMAYTLRISQLAQTYSWKSVLLYDRKCRMVQASTNSGWGEEPNGLATLCLDRKPPQKQKVTEGNKGTLHQNKQKDPCRLYNVGRCEFNPCRFTHACMVCRGPHPSTEHAFAYQGQGQGERYPPRTMEPPQLWPNAKNEH